MLDKLKNIARRYEEIQHRLNQPETYDDVAVSTKLQKEQNKLEPLMETYQSYLNAVQTMEDAELLMGDPEFRELAKEEFEQAKEDRSRLEHELKILLLPKDPNDDKNVIVEIRGGVGGEGIDGDNAGELVDLGDVLHMLQEVGQTLFQSHEVFVVKLGLGHTAVVLERTDSSDHDDCGGGKTREAALDVEELLRTEIRAEARFRHHIIRKLEGKLCSNYGIAAMGNVCKRAAMDQDRCMFKCLYQVRLECFLHGDGCSTCRIDVLNCDRLVVICISDYCPADPLFEVLEVI